MAKRRTYPITPQAPLRIKAVDYQSQADEGSGVCLECGAPAEQYVEPDAEGYRCSACGAMAVMGLEQMLISELLEIA
jgi:DNA-directed RNA polymerase subunit RPC12/RpoP